MSQSPQSVPAGPWPLAVGLLAACATTMIGIFAGCEPGTILYRCMIAGGVVTVIAGFVRSLWQLVDSD